MMAKIPATSLSTAPVPAWVRTGEPLLWQMGGGHEIALPGYFYDCRKRSHERQVTLQLTLRGAGFFQKARRRTVLAEGMAFLHMIGGDFSYGRASESEPYELVWINLNGPAAESWYRRIVAKHGHVLAFGDAGREVIAPLLLGLVNQNSRPPDRYLASSRLYHVLMTVLSVLSQSRLATRPLMHRAMEITQRRAGDPRFNVAMLAEELDCSREHLARQFRAATGVSPSDYLTQQRLRMAGRALRAGPEKLETIARRCGFTGANYFCRCFRSHVGVTPKAFRTRQWIMMP